MIARIARPIAKKVSSSSSRRFSHKPRQPESNAKGQQGELERLREEVKKRDQRIAELEKQIGEKDKQIGEQEKQIADLERQLALRKQNSTNSSKPPPSSDGLAGEPRRRGRRKQSRRNPGGQPGHRGAHRGLVPAEPVDEIRHVLPEQCQHCGHRLPTQIEQVQTTGPVGDHVVIHAAKKDNQLMAVTVKVGMGNMSSIKTDNTILMSFAVMLVSILAYFVSEVRATVCDFPYRSGHCD